MSEEKTYTESEAQRFLAARFHGFAARQSLS